MNNIDITISCKVEKHGGQYKLLFDDHVWKDWGLNMCAHGEQLRWHCDECGSLLENKIRHFLDEYGNDYEISVEDNKHYLRHDIFPEVTPKQAGDFLQLVQEDLSEFDLELYDYYIEHDCITGFVKLKEDNE